MGPHRTFARVLGGDEAVANGAPRAPHLSNLTDVHAKICQGGPVPRANLVVSHGAQEACRASQPREALRHVGGAAPRGARRTTASVTASPTASTTCRPSPAPSP